MTHFGGRCSQRSTKQVCWTETGTLRGRCVVDNQQAKHFHIGGSAWNPSGNSSVFLANARRSGGCCGGGVVTNEQIRREQELGHVRYHRHKIPQHIDLNDSDDSATLITSQFNVPVLNFGHNAATGVGPVSCGILYSERSKMPLRQERMKSGVPLMYARKTRGC
jgi:hypothetical protein